MSQRKKSKSLKVLIVGTGPAGLGAAAKALELGFDYLILEAKSHPFGHCRSFSLGGIVFDEGPHISFTKDKTVQELFSKSSHNPRVLNPKMVNFWKGSKLPHPLQTNLYSLPDELRQKVIESMNDCRGKENEDWKSYEHWLNSSFGKVFTEEFPAVYTEKYWTVTPEKLTTDWIGQRISRPSIDQMLASQNSETAPKQEHYFSHFRYPREGGFDGFLKNSLRLHENKILYNQRVTSLDSKSRFVSTESGAEFEFDILISSAPLDLLVPTVIDAPPDIRLAAEELNCSSVSLYSFVYKTDKSPPSHWAYIYDKDICFVRMYFPEALRERWDSPIQAVQVEVYSSRYRPTDPKIDNYENVISGLERLGILKAGNITAQHHQFVSHANVIFDHERAKNVPHILGYLNDRCIFPVGRYGKWAYLWSDESYLDGFSTLDKALS